MRITLSQIAKRYNNQVLFQGIDYTLEPNKPVAILGINGSGKSTLLQIIAGYTIPSMGQVAYTLNGTPIQVQQVYKHLAMCSPSMELIGELTVQEFLAQHFLHKKNIATIDHILAEINMTRAAHTKLDQCSSGMRQRVKLAQAFYTHAPLLLLDEPCSNLDAAGIATYHFLIEKYCSNRTVVISSNVQDEYNFCEQHINISQYQHGTQ